MFDDEKTSNVNKKIFYIDISNVVPNKAVFFLNDLAELFECEESAIKRAWKEGRLVKRKRFGTGKPCMYYVDVIQHLELDQFIEAVPDEPEKITIAESLTFSATFKNSKHQQ